MNILINDNLFKTRINNSIYIIKIIKKKKYTCALIK